MTARRLPRQRSVAMKTLLFCLTLLGCGSLLGVSHATVTTVRVTPAGDTLTTIGATRQFMAVATDQYGHVVNGVNVSWNSSNAAVATVSATGMATARANGQATIGASVGVITGLAVLTVKQP